MSIVNYFYGPVFEIEKSDWIGDITYAGIPGWTQTEYGTLIPPPGIDFMATTDFTATYTDNTRRKCSYCGQYGEPRTACKHCGAPIDPEGK
jgi:hypothetical protein